MADTHHTGHSTGRLRDLRSLTPGGRDAVITVAGGIAGQIPVLVSGVIVARTLGVEDRGHLALLWVVALVLTFVSGMGIPSAITYWVAREPGVSRPLAHMVAKIALLQAVLAMLVQSAVLFIVLGGDRTEVVASAATSVLVVPSMIVVMYGMAFLQGLRRFRVWTVIRVCAATLYAGAVILLAVLKSGHLLAVTVAWTVGFMIAAMVALFRTKAALPATELGSRPPSYRELQRFGARAFLGAAAPSDTFQLDQAMVGLFISSRALGLYVVGNSFTNLPTLVAQSVGYVAYPHVAQQSAHDAARRAMWTWTAVTLIASGLIVAALELAAGWLVPLMFGRAFVGAVGLTRLLLVAALLISVRRVLADAARGAGYPGLGTIAELASTGVLILTMAILASGLGVSGVALALVVAGVAGLFVMLAGLARSAPDKVIQKDALPMGPRVGCDPTLLVEGP